MMFHDFLESKHVRTNIALQQVYHPYGQGKILAAAGLVAAQRKILTWINYPILLGEYVLIALRLKKAPLNAQALIASYNAQARAAAEAAAQAELEKQKAGTPPSLLTPVDPTK